MKGRIENLIEIVLSACIPWIMEKDEAIQFIDPLDHQEISAHYGATHAAVALIIYGKKKKDERTLKQGEDLLFSVLDRWERNKILPDFHNDFNNFALCVLDLYVKGYHDRIQKVVLETADSSHDTVNWLPMRWYVNKCKFEWTSDEKYLNICRACADKIKSATFNDGFIDDRLPVGMSFNLQYDVATVAVMQFLRVQGEEVDINKETGALLNAVCPDGDINYLGRGTNQIFAWGLWVYLLSTGELKELDRALNYLHERLPTMLNNNNLMLNDYPGEEKYMWWDYHYCSVYTAHLFLWLVLAWNDIGKKKIDPIIVNDGSSGVKIHKKDDIFIVTFDGRTEYLAERGPVIAAIWTKEYGVLCKGTFGPWKGTFGNKYTQIESTLRNFLGIVCIDSGTNYSRNRIIRKIQQKIVNPNISETISPVFGTFDIFDDGLNNVRITFRTSNSKKRKYINIPVLDNALIKCEDKNNEIVLLNQIYIKNQYGICKILQAIVESDEIVIEFPRCL